LDAIDARSGGYVMTFRRMALIAAPALVAIAAMVVPANAG